MGTLNEWSYNYNRACREINKILKEIFANKRIEESGGKASIHIYTTLPSGEESELEQPIEFSSFEVRTFISEEE